MLVFILVDQIKSTVLSQNLFQHQIMKRDQRKKQFVNFYFFIFFFFFEFDISFILCDQKWGETIKPTKTTKRYQEGCSFRSFHYNGRTAALITKTFLVFLLLQSRYEL